MRIDPATATGGAPLPPGDYDVRATLSIAGFSAETAVRAGKTPPTIRIPLDGGRRSLRGRIGSAVRALGVRSR